MNARTPPKAGSGSDEVAKILKSGLALLEKVQGMNPNSASYALKTEMCEAELRDVLRLDPRNIAAVVALGALFAEYYDEQASEEALSLLDDALVHAPRNKDLKAGRKRHEAILDDLASDG